MNLKIGLLPKIVDFQHRHVVYLGAAASVGGGSEDESAVLMSGSEDESEVTLSGSADESEVMGSVNESEVTLSGSEDESEVLLSGLTPITLATRSLSCGNMARGSSLTPAAISALT